MEWDRGRQKPSWPFFEMQEVSVREKVIESDVLCIGGGIAGLMAAIRASELGAKVVVAEKGNTLRSGAAATGNDHFLCYIPEVHGDDMKGIIAAMRETQLRNFIDFTDREIFETWLNKSLDMIHIWQNWGIPMKYGGKYEFAGHTFPGSPFFYLKYEGQNQKRILTAEAQKRGIEIINRVMVFDLLAQNGQVFGALGVGTRDEVLTQFYAKSVILGTGTVSRLYPSLTPGWMFNITRPGSVSGDGRAMAYRAGSELVNVEMVGSHAGPKYFTRSGQATWVGVVKDASGKAIGPFLAKPDKKYSDIIIEVNKGLFDDYARSGKGPVYMDCTGISEEDYQYMMHWMEHEGNSALKPYLDEEKIDLRRNPVEFATYGMRSSAGRIWQNILGETSTSGLYAAGDEVAGVGIAEAAISGWIAGENAASSRKKAIGKSAKTFQATVDQWKASFKEMKNRSVGADWKEANIALQQIMQDYSGRVRSETLLEAGSRLLNRLKQKTSQAIVARNQHELMRCLEVINLLDIGQLVFEAAIERKETRGLHNRPDYPYTNPLMDQQLIVKKAPSGPVMEWRKVKR
jgi:succinate dehydrogenase/fumarate reductase flavoprotein subunit